MDERLLETLFPQALTGIFSSSSITPYSSNFSKDVSLFSITISSYPSNSSKDVSSFSITSVSQGHKTSNSNQLGIYHNFVAQAHAHTKTIADQVQTKAHFNQVFIPSVKI